MLKGLIVVFEVKPQKISPDNSRPPIAKNCDWSLTPAAFGGLTYEVLDCPQTDVVTINTSRGKCKIYVGPDTSAKFAKK